MSSRQSEVDSAEVGLGCEPDVELTSARGRIEVGSPGANWRSPGLDKALRSHAQIGFCSASSYTKKEPREQEPTTRSNCLPLGSREIGDEANAELSLKKIKGKMRSKWGSEQSGNVLC
jgi:hypothetical protein